MEGHFIISILVFIAVASDKMDLGYTGKPRGGQATGPIVLH